MHHVVMHLASSNLLNYARETNSFNCNILFKRGLDSKKKKNCASNKFLDRLNLFLDFEQREHSFVLFSVWIYCVYVYGMLQSKTSWCRIATLFKMIYGKLLGMGMWSFDKSSGDNHAQDADHGRSYFDINDGRRSILCTW